MSKGVDNALARPRGLWKTRGTVSSAHHAPEQKPSTIGFYNLVADSIAYHDPDSDSLPDRCCSGDDSDYSSSSSFFRKRRRLSPPTSEEDSEVQYWDYSRKCGPQNSHRLEKWITRSKLMDTSSTVGPGQPTSADRTCNLEDWEDLKELFTKAAEMYESQSAAESISLLRAVIHECHRFLRAYEDPSVLYTTSEKTAAVSMTPPPGKRMMDELPTERPLYPPPGAEKPPTPITHPAQEVEKKCKCKDLPTSFYTILGTTLFFLGNLIEQEPSLVLEGEPVIPTPYWLAALDVFETGENLPIRTSGRGCPHAPEDWRMAIIWGRTLVNLAGEVLRRQKEANKNGKKPKSPPPPTEYIIPPPGQYRMPTELNAPSTDPDKPTWPLSSPFATIASRRPPISTHIDLGSTTPQELLLLAQDQFSRGIFHMPHPLHQSQRKSRYVNAPLSSAVSTVPPPFTSTPPHRKPKAAEKTVSTVAGSSSSTTVGSSSTDTVNPNLLPPETFSRAKELYTIALEVLLLAENLEVPSERATWASWADSVFSQMKMEADMDAWRANITSARGRCHLIAGGALAEGLEARLGGEGKEGIEEDKEDEDVWECEDARDARDYLVKAVAFLEKAREAVVQNRMETETVGSDFSASAVAEIADDVDDGGYPNDDDEEIIMVEHAGTDAGKSVDEEAEMSSLLAEALLTLANLTKDKKEREALYLRAQKEGADVVAIELDSDDVDDEDRMDES